MFFLEKTRSWYGRFERPISSISLILGFVFDAFTLKRVDTLWENFWILGHIIIVGIFIVLIHIKENEAGDEKNPDKFHFWYVNILQFFFGGLLSSYLVFYFRSGDIFVTWPFILILVFAFWANESLKRQYVRFSFQVSLLFLSVFLFLIFLLPVLMHQIGTRVFLLSGLFSLIFITFFISVLLYFIKDRFKENIKLIFYLILSIYGLVNFLYFTNLIPPIPLSLKDGGIYHSIDKDNNGNYNVTYEDYGWGRYFNLYPDFKETPTSSVYAYSAIFSPQNLNLTILHEWQYYDKLEKKWITDFVISLKVVGGRDGGFRTFSTRSDLIPANWRVNIKTEGGLNIGCLRFNILAVNTEPALLSDIKK
ncbi:MAG: DUF2914 domain-containing protein [bacterium]